MQNENGSGHRSLEESVLTAVAVMDLMLERLAISIEHTDANGGMIAGGLVGMGRDAIDGLCKGFNAAHAEWVAVRHPQAAATKTTKPANGHN